MADQKVERFSDRIRRLAKEAAGDIGKQKVAAALLGIASKAMTQATDETVTISFLRAHADYLEHGTPIENGVKSHMRKLVRRLTAFR